MILKFFQYILIPSVNYGPFVDISSQQNTYNEIDQELVSYAKDLFCNFANDEITKDLLITPIQANGL